MVFLVVAHRLPGELAVGGQSGDFRRAGGLGGSSSYMTGAGGAAFGGGGGGGGGGGRDVSMEVQGGGDATRARDLMSLPFSCEPPAPATP